MMFWTFSILTAMMALTSGQVVLPNVVNGVYVGAYKSVTVAKTVVMTNSSAAGCVNACHGYDYAGVDNTLNCYCSNTAPLPANTAISMYKVATPKKVVCYMGNWAVYRTDNFSIGAIDPQMCTHYNYAFAKITAAGAVNAGDVWADLTTGGGLGGYSKFVGLRTKNTQAKVLLSIGGGDPTISPIFSTIAKSATLRTTFSNNLFAFLTLHQFDGADIDWEYPGRNGGDAAVDKANFVLLLQALRTKFNTRSPPFLLTAAVAVTPWAVTQSYNIPAISTPLDFINLMTYDYHGYGWSVGTGQNAPLYASSVDTDLTLNVDNSVKYWIAQGAPAAKLILGMGTYGRTFTLANALNRGLGAAVTGNGLAGPVTGGAGTLGYNEICAGINAGGWTVTYDTVQKVPYASKSTQWVGYDNVQSIQIKAQYVRDMALGGSMVWSVEQDDFSPKCSAVKFPLLNAINTVMYA